MNLGELRGLLLWVYFMGISTTWSRSGKPGWPTDGDVACGPSGGPQMVMWHVAHRAAQLLLIVKEEVQPRISRPDPWRPIKYLDPVRFRRKADP